jgi:hypothetical protein
MRGRHCGSVETFVECMQERLRLVPPGTVEKKNASNLDPDEDTGRGYKYRKNLLTPRSTLSAWEAYALASQHRLPKHPGAAAATFHPQTHARAGNGSHRCSLFSAESGLGSQHSR